MQQQPMRIGLGRQGDRGPRGPIVTGRNENSCVSGKVPEILKGMSPETLPTTETEKNE
jgi:hypothetical protein